MATFFRRSVLWVIDYRFDGHPRRWHRLLPEGTDPAAVVARQLADWYGARAQLGAIRLASADEETAYLRDEAPALPMCPAGRRPPSEPPTR